MSDALLALGRRIIVTGLAGSGKSTFSLALAAKTDLPVVHLDLHFWKPGWVAPSETEWREKQRVALAGNAWMGRWGCRGRSRPCVPAVQPAGGWKNPLMPTG